jgi:hypothetical protein
MRSFHVRYWMTTSFKGLDSSVARSAALRIGMVRTNSSLSACNRGERFSVWAMVVISPAAISGRNLQSRVWVLQVLFQLAGTFGGTSLRSVTL